jgi:hypothetical protein
MAFGTHIPSNKAPRPRLSKTPRLHVESKHRKKKKEKKERPPSVARIRIQQRQRRIESEQQDQRRWNNLAGAGQEGEKRNSKGTYTCFKIFLFIDIV